MAGIACLTLLAACSSPKESKPERTILLTIDGMAAGLNDSIEMPNFNALMKEGVLFKEVYLPLAAHPKMSDTYPWSCSIPNPVLMSGTVFIGQDSIHQNLIQASFTERPTAFTVNSPSYVAIKDGFTIYEQMSKGEMTPVYPDEESIEAAKKIILAQNPEFMRIHCQGLGSAGSRTKTPDQVYTDNIWHPESPYIRQAKYADQLLGEFVQWMKDNNLWDNTVLIVMGDHGQAATGWHPPYEPGGYETQMLIAGKDIRKNAVYDYAEIIDVAPTIAWLHQVPTPKYSNGRILKEIREGEQPANVEPLMKNLDLALIKHKAENPDTITDPGLDIIQIGQWHKGPQGNDYPAFVRAQVAKVQ